MTNRPFIVSALLLASCAARAGAPSPARTTEPAMPSSMTPRPERTFSDGPAIEPPAALLEWIRSLDRGTLLRLPVVVRLGPNRLAVGDAFIGATRERAADAIALKLDDSALGIALVDTIRARCPDAGASCAVWLEGTWGPLVGVAPTGAPWPFAVRAVRGLVEASAGEVRAQYATAR